MSYFIGIDIAKYLHYATVIDDNGNTIVEPFSFSNDLYGFNTLLDTVHSLDSKELIFGTESTAHYSNNLNDFLVDHGYIVRIINPIQSSKLRSINIRNSKNDSIDSNVVANCLLLGYGREYSNESRLHQDLKFLSRRQHNLTNELSKLKIQLTATLDIVFPELQTICKSGIHRTSIYTMLLEFPSSYDLANANITRLSNILKKSSRGKFSKDKAIQIKELAKRSISCKNLPSQSIILKQLINHINFLNSQLKETEKLIYDVLLNINSTILSIPGIGKSSAACIISEIGDITQFKSPQKLVAFAGLDPITRQSGQFKAKSTRMSKRGSPYLRNSIIFSAFNVVKNDMTFKLYYDKKISEGKSHYCALGHVGKKLLHLIFKLMTDNTEFITNYENKF